MPIWSSTGFIFITYHCQHPLFIKPLIHHGCILPTIRPKRGLNFTSITKLPSKPCSTKVVCVVCIVFVFCRTRFWVVVVEVWLVICVLYLYKLQTTVPTDRSRPGGSSSSSTGGQNLKYFFGFQSVDWRRYWIFGRLWAVDCWLLIRYTENCRAFLQTVTQPSAKSFDESKVKKIIVVLDRSTS